MKLSFGQRHCVNSSGAERYLSTIVLPMNKPENNSTFRYDAFISHSHVDKPAVRWFSSFLTNYWVPFRRRRRLFVDHHALNAGELSKHIVQALEESRFLVVCNSSDAAESEWVQKELATYKEIHRGKNILSVQIGSKDDTALVDALPDGAYIPDLSGVSDDLSSEELRTYRENALSVLAPILGYKDKVDLTDIVRRRKIRLAIFSTVVISVAITGFGVRQYWLSTVDGLHRTTLRQVLNAAETETRDTPFIITTVPAVAKLGMDAVGQFTEFYQSDLFKPLVLATGYASLDPPQCDAAVDKINGVDKEAMATSPETVLAVAKRCDSSLVAQVKTTLGEDLDKAL